VIRFRFGGREAMRLAEVLAIGEQHAALEAVAGAYWQQLGLPWPIGRSRSSVGNSPGVITVVALEHGCRFLAGYLAVRCRQTLHDHSKGISTWDRVDPRWASARILASRSDLRQ
jgi:hypothetical protein